MVFQHWHQAIASKTAVDMALAQQVPMETFVSVVMVGVGRRAIFSPALLDATGKALASKGAAFATRTFMAKLVNSEDAQMIVRDKATVIKALVYAMLGLLGRAATHSLTRRQPPLYL